MQQIARLLELPTNIVESMYQPPSSVQPAVSLRAMPGGATLSSKIVLPFLRRILLILVERFLLGLVLILEQCVSSDNCPTIESSLQTNAFSR